MYKRLLSNQVERNYLTSKGVEATFVRTDEEGYINIKELPKEVKKIQRQ